MNHCKQCSKDITDDVTVCAPCFDKIIKGTHNFRFDVIISNEALRKMEELTEFHTMGACSVVDVIIDSIQAILTTKFGENYVQVLYMGEEK